MRRTASTKSTGLCGRAFYSASISASPYGAYCPGKEGNMALYFVYRSLEEMDIDMPFLKTSSEEAAEAAWEILRPHYPEVSIVEGVGEFGKIIKYYN